MALRASWTSFGGATTGFSIENRRDLFLAEDVAFNGQRAVDRADAVDSSQTQVL